MSIRFQAAVYHRLKGEVLAGLPFEVVGLLVGCGEVITDAVPLVNHHPVGTRGYIAHRREVDATVGQVEASGGSVLGMYHSHPDCDAVCSDADARARQPGELMAIFGTVAGLFREARLYRLTDGPALEIPFTVEGAAPVQQREG